MNSNRPDIAPRPAVRRLRAPALAAATLMLAAMAPVAGPLQIGPSGAQADAQHSTALLSTTIVNRGRLPDRLIRVDCPASGHAALRNATMHDDIQSPTLDQQQAALHQKQDPSAPRPRQAGLDIPQALNDQVQPVLAQIDLTQATQPLNPGALVPCSLSFAHSGQRIVIFGIGVAAQPTPEP